MTDTTLLAQTAAIVNTLKGPAAPSESTHEVVLKTSYGEFRAHAGPETNCKIAGVRLKAMLDELPTETGRIKVTIPAADIQDIIVRPK